MFQGQWTRRGLTTLGTRTLSSAESVGTGGLGLIIRSRGRLVACVPRLVSGTGALGAPPVGASVHEGLTFASNSSSHYSLGSVFSSSRGKTYANVGLVPLEDVGWRILTSNDAGASLNWVSLGFEWLRALLAMANQALISLVPALVWHINAAMVTCVGRPIVGALL